LLDRLRQVPIGNDLPHIADHELLLLLGGHPLKRCYTPTSDVIDIVTGLTLCTYHVSRDGQITPYLPTGSLIVLFLRPLVLTFSEQPFS